MNSFVIIFMVDTRKQRSLASFTPDMTSFAGEYQHSQVYCAFCILSTLLTNDIGEQVSNKSVYYLVKLVNVVEPYFTSVMIPLV